MTYDPADYRFEKTPTPIPGEGIMEPAPVSLIADQYPHIEKQMQKAVFHEQGFAIVTLEQTEVGGVTVDLVCVRLKPGAKVSAHLHEEGGEIEFPLTPIISVMGEVVLDTNGDPIFGDDNKVKAVMEDPVLSMPGVPLSVPEGKVHEFINPSETAYADILFFLPHEHATAEDKTLAQSPDIGVAALRTLVQNYRAEQDLA